MINFISFRYQLRKVVMKKIYGYKTKTVGFIVGVAVCLMSVLAYAQEQESTQKKQIISDAYLENFKNSLQQFNFSNGITYNHKHINSEISYFLLHIEWESSEMKREDRIIPGIIGMLLPKGSKKYPRDVIDGELEKYAIDFECHDTSDPFPCGTTVNKIECVMSVDNEYLDKGLDILYSSIQAPEFHQKDYDAALNHSKAGYQGSCRQSDFVITNLSLNKIFYNHDHPFFTTELQLKQSIDKLTRKKVVDKYKSVFNAARMSLFSASSLKSDGLVEKLKNQFGQINGWYVDLKKSLMPKGSDRKLNVKYFEATGAAADQANVFFLMKSASPLGRDQDESVTSEVMHAVLSEMLHQNIRTRLGLSYAVGAYEHSMHNFSLSGIYATTSKPVEVMKQVNLVLDDIKTNKVSDQELYNAKLKVLLQNYKSIADPVSMLKKFSQDMIYHRKIDRVYNYAELVEAVDAEAILELAKIQLKDYQVGLYGNKKLLAHIKLSDMNTH